METGKYKETLLELPIRELEFGQSYQVPEDLESHIREQLMRRCPCIEDVSLSEVHTSRDEVYDWKTIMMDVGVLSESLYKGWECVAIEIPHPVLSRVHPFIEEHAPSEVLDEVLPVVRGYKGTDPKLLAYKTELLLREEGTL